MKKSKWKLLSLLPLSLVLFLGGCSGKMAVLDPKGPVAKTQYDLIVWSFILMLAIIAVVFILFTVILIRYRERPDKHDYEPPEQEGNLLLEVIWTAIPVLIVIALAVPTVKATMALEKAPKAVATQNAEDSKAEDKKPLVIHVTSADWKWIFSYPEQNIETVNYVNIPEDRPVKFKLTSVGPMNSFWVPELGGQKYTMAGMETKLYLLADHVGQYTGRSANFSGEGFTDMTFDVEAVTKKDFNKWVQTVQSNEPKLTKKEYSTLIKPGHVGRSTYSSTHLEWIDHAKQNSHMSNNMDMKEDKEDEKSDK
ncbi:cytochrome aa3 quinol oxidase subunit II [Priestia koreensis]|uniref:cytochrome aa3 quinol oxidase subunit II n=1 Tax=Priestia koreensis TaxID=284581 RepID=UPI001F5A989F|nr:cytochrome aa3 quinol oxidase subunit II [Priestia koreensis]MCM3006643.1 cytochrome aa3 quinol oxidase subunit II [Priestia koreensis]UNL84945.1 cytochrome aa3 quinol oxidase subunit II [Priestia koreensis]